MLRERPRDSAELLPQCGFALFFNYCFLVSIRDLVDTVPSVNMMGLSQGPYVAGHISTT